MSEKISENSIKELIDSFIAYRNLIAPLQDSLNSVSKSYEEIRNDLDNLTKVFREMRRRSLKRCILR